MTESRWHKRHITLVSQQEWWPNFFDHRSMQHHVSCQGSASNWWPCQNWSTRATQRRKSDLNCIFAWTTSVQQNLNARCKSSSGRAEFCCVWFSICCMTIGKTWRLQREAVVRCHYVLRTVFGEKHLILFLKHHFQKIMVVLAMSRRSFHRIIVAFLCNCLIQMATNLIMI